MPFPVWAWFLTSLVASVALAPKPARPRPAALDDFDVPTAELDRPLPVLFGTKRITGPNVLWYGDLGTTRIRQRSLFSSTTVGYRYYLGMHLGVCHGPVDEFSRLEVGDKLVWEGSQTSNGSIDVDEPELFGGDKREGGISGRISVMMGAADQAANEYLASQFSPTPAFRGMFGLVWERNTGVGYRGYIGNTPYLKPWAVTCKRIHAGWFNDEEWYPEKAEIAGVGMNPAHIVYQVLTDPRFGMGAPVASIHDASFRQAADTLHDEGFGLNLLWNQATTVDDFLQIVLDHIAGVLAFDRETNQYVLKLVRGDYVVDELETFDESNCELQSLQTQAWGETVNELTITYTDPDTLQSTPLTIQDLANIRAQDAIVSEKIDRSGISSHTLIRTVAGRELRQRSTPLRQGRLVADRNFWPYTLGDVFKLNWAARNLSGLVCRVIKLDEGTLENGAIGVEFIEDIYALEGAEYSEVQPPGDDPNPPVEPPADNPNPNVQSFQTSTPPANPNDGDRYYIPAEPEPTGDWAGHAGDIAEWDADTGQWIFIDVPPGVIVYDEGTEQHFTTDGNGSVQIVGLLSPDAIGEAAGGYAVDQSYLWDIHSNRGTEIRPGGGNVPDWIFERRLRCHGYVVNVHYTGGGVSPGDLSWQYHKHDALTGVRVGSSNAGGKLVDIAHVDGERYWYQVGDTAAATPVPTVRKVDSRALILGGTASGISDRVYQDASAIAFGGIAKIGNLVYVSAQDTVASQHSIRVLDADTLAEVNRWTYTGPARPGLLVTNGEHLWALAHDQNFGAADPGEGEGLITVVFPQAFVDGTWYGRGNILAETSPLLVSDNGVTWQLAFDPEGATNNTPGTNNLVRGPDGHFFATRGIQIGRSNTTTYLDAWTWADPNLGSQAWDGLRYLNGTLYAFTGGQLDNPRIIAYDAGENEWVNVAVQDFIGQGGGITGFVISEILYEPNTPRFLIFGTEFNSSGNETARVYESTDLATWVLVDTLNPPGEDDVQVSGAARNGSTIVVALRVDDEFGRSTPAIARSTDWGDTWSYPSITWPDTSPLTTGANGVVYDGSQFITTGLDWAGVSADGAVWSFATDLFGNNERIGQLVTGGGTTAGLASLPSGARGVATTGPTAGFSWSECGVEPTGGGVAWRINLSTGAIEALFKSPYVRASDAELVWDPVLEVWEIWISFLANGPHNGSQFVGEDGVDGAQAPRLVRYRTSSSSAPTAPTVSVGEITGQLENIAVGSQVTLTRDGDLLSYGKNEPNVIALANIPATDPVFDLWEQHLNLALFDADIPGFYRAPNLRAIDLLDDHPSPQSIEADTTYVPIADDAGGIYRLQLSEVGIGGGGGGGGFEGQATVRLYRATSQEIPSSTPTPIEWSDQDFDDEDFWPHGSELSRIVVPDAGRYLVQALVTWDSSTDGARSLAVRANGTTVRASTTAAAVDGLVQQISTIVDLEANEYVEIVVESTAAGAVDIVAGVATPHVVVGRIASAVVPTQLRGATWTRGELALTTPANDVLLFFPKAARIYGVTVLGMNTTGSCVVDVLRSPVGNFPPQAGDSICGSSRPEITGGRTLVDTTLDGWDTEIAAGDVLALRLVSVSDFRQVFVQLHIREIE